MSDSIVIEESNGEIIVIEPTVVINQTTCNSAWGGIAGDIADQADLIAEFAKKMDVDLIILPNNADLNEVKTNGRYFFDYTALNSPLNSNGIMVVDISDYNISQTVCSENNMWIRSTDEIGLLNEHPWEQVASYTDLEMKVDKVAGKGLSTNDYTDTEKTKLAAAVTSSTIATIVTLTQAAYDALNPKVATTLYIITGA